MMASADVRKALQCSICVNIYTDPVNLQCGHNFCRGCIDGVLETQAMAGGYCCPECRDEFHERPALHKNLTLCNLVEDFLASQLDQEKMVVFCTYCVNSAVAAVKSCLLCETSLCENHLKVHSKAPEHVLSHLTTSPEKRICPIHKKALEYHCIEDATCICATCKQDVAHQGHNVETLDKAAEKKKNGLYHVLYTLIAKREDIRKRVQSLKERRKEVQEKADGTTKKYTGVSGDTRRELEDLDKRVLTELSRKAERDSLSLSELIQKLEAMMDQVFGKMRHIEELRNTADPLTVLQNYETGALCDPEEGHNEAREMDDGGGLDVNVVLHALRTLSDTTAVVRKGIYLVEPTQIILEENMANDYLEISGDMKVASYTTTSQGRPKTPQRFLSRPQVLSIQSFSSGRHYWEADVGGSDRWRVGVSYPSTDKCDNYNGSNSLIGYNNKSWCLEREGNNQYSVIHNSQKTVLPDIIFIHRVRVYVNFEAGQVSFYHLSHPIRHLHTFTTTFTEPLHAALGVYGNGPIKL